MKTRIIILSALAALGFSQAAAQTDKISSVALNGLGVVTVTERIGVVGNQAGTVGDNLAGLAYVAGDVPLDGSPNSVAFYALSVSGAAVPPTAATAFTSYGALTFPSQVDTYADVAAKLVVLSPAGSYSGLAFAADDLGFGSAFQFYMIDHRGGTDYFAQITPGTGTSSLIRDLKPMSWAAPGGVAGTPADTGLSGYFALTYASTPAASYPANSMYYLRTDASNHTQFGYMIPALTGGSFDTIDLDTAKGSFGATGYSTLAWMTDALGGNPANQFYYLRQDNGPGGTGNTILGRLDPSLVAGTRTISDIANLGGVFDTLTYTPDATGTGVGWGSTQFFATGSLTATAQSISFPAIADRLISAGSFTVTPSASSTLPLTLTVEASSTGTATISGPVAGVFTVTPLTPGVITLQARQSGPGFDTNWLNQSFNAQGVPVINSASTASGTVGIAFSYATTAAGSPTSYTASPLPAGVLFNTTTGAFSGTPTTAAVTVVTLTATNGIGTSANFTLTITVAAAGVAPVITNSPLTAAGTVGTPFSFTVTASGSPTSFAAAPLPAGLLFNTTTGVFSGTPTTAAVTAVTLGATNAAGTGNATLTVTIAASAPPPGGAPVITSSLSVTGVGGTAGFSYNIAATGTPTSYSATPLPAGLVFDAVNGLISGTPTTAATTVVALGATNASGTGTASLTITITEAPSTVNPAILTVLPGLTAPVANWSDHRPPQFEVAPVPGVRVTFDMEYRVEGTYTVGVGHSAIPGESLVTVARGPDIDLIVSLMENGIKEYDIRIRGNTVTTTVKLAVGLCATVEQPAVVLPGSPGATDTATVFSNVLFFHDESTAAAADLMSIEAYGIAVVENGNLVLKHTAVTNLQWRYAGTRKVAGYTSTGDTQADLAAMANLSSPLGAFVREQGNEAVADQALFIFNVFRTDGASGRADNPGHHATAYWQAPWYVYVHELGHNFGLLHDRAFSSAPDSNNVWRYGFAWTKPFTAGATTTQVGYGTMMTQWGLEYIQPYFSSPAVNITYVGNYDTAQEFITTQKIGVEVGQPKAADNAKALREGAVAMSGYRLVAGAPPSTVTTPVVTPPATTPAPPSSSGGGDLSLWFYAALAAIGCLRMRFPRQ